jgi:alkanesulfonate monooxygenase SsuD/methylene tetrahydromethanopterin reductase-like flavin-dependent oxidoreductase (luciferase family)
VKADVLGIDAILIAPAAGDDALILAASLAEATTDIRVVAVVPPGLHPVHLAERIAVTDQVLAGRLVVVLDCTADSGAAAETVTVLHAALAARPFRHEGQRWKIPAGLHRPTADRFRVTPSPAQLALPLWVTGVGAPAVATSTGATWLPRVGERPASRPWPTGAAAGAVRPARRPLARLADNAIDASQTAAALLAERDDWGLDLALLEVGGSCWADDVGVLARAVRPRVQMSSVPAAVDRFWAASGADG